MKAWYTPITYPKCEESGCKYSATHHVYDTKGNRVGDYCPSHTADHVNKLNGVKPGARVNYD